ncbi:MAG: lytic murein transglycosylase, partial [Methyloligellaceae bacterium]
MSLHSRVSGTAGLACALLAIVLPAAVALTPDGAEASEAAYRRFVKSFWATARKRGISRDLYNRAFKGLKPDPVVVKKNAYQPEFVLSAAQYLSLTVSDTRIEKGRAKLEELGPVLEKIEQRWGVDRHVLLAIWG